MPKYRKFKNTNQNFSDFDTTTRPMSPSPKRMDYNSKVTTKDDKVSKCTYIHPDTAKRCRNLLGLYPEYCELHTMMINNVYIAKSQIPNAGNGLYAGPYGFKKNDIIGQYNYPWNAATYGKIERRCSNKKCWSHVFCETDDPHNDTKCWDGLDIRSTLMRNINDAHNSGHRNNAIFTISNGNVYVVATRNIRHHQELFVNYGDTYWLKE